MKGPIRVQWTKRAAGFSSKSKSRSGLILHQVQRTGSIWMGEIEIRILEYLEYLSTCGYSTRTLKSKKYYLRIYLEWSEERGITKAEEMTESLAERYQGFVLKYRSIRKELLSVETQIHLIIAVKSFYLYLEKKEYIRKSPFLEIKLPRKGRRLPRNVLSVEEVERILSVPDLGTPLGIRNRAILELFYSTGMRLFELQKLETRDIDFLKKRIFVREGKGKKDRVIPVSKRALDWTRKYLEEVRLGYVKEVDNQSLFLSWKGNPLQTNWILNCVTQAKEQAGVEKKGSTHMFRHTTATLMLENGADIRHIQEMLGHKDLGTTQIYTHVAIRKLKEVYEKTHPSAGSLGNTSKNKNVDTQSSDTS
ncbi:recombinase XerC [Leptospira interrogans]|uniref:tyrosine-type recombinase/integrase n=1 Tax=Leptospira interrogans TaxID=173 RepID=UPI0009CEB6B7|nr:tyrosine-type recombinase/integrase [Leptospira interrogans]OQM33279.1 recombinase XerC [Leptospira interrogans]